MLFARTSSWPVAFDGGIAQLSGLLTLADRPGMDGRGGGGKSLFTDRGPLMGSWPGAVETAEEGPSDE